MRLNQLPIFRTPDTRLNTEEIEGRIYSFAIIILKLANGSYTWRGEGQHLPNSTTFVAAAEVVFAGDDDECDEWPLDVYPVAIDLNGSRHYFGTQAEWEALPFDDHDVSWDSNGYGRLCGAQFVRT